jgi:hypothetical protein
VSETKEPKIARKGVLIALGIICIILVACLGGAIAGYTLVLKDRNNVISSLNAHISQLDSQISQLNSEITNLQNQIVSDNSTINSLSSNLTNLQQQLNSMLNWQISLEDIILGNPSEWVNRSVIIDGTLDGPLIFPFESLPFSYELGSGNQTIGVSFDSSVNLNASFRNQGPEPWDAFFLNSSLPVRVYGVVQKGYDVSESFTGEPPQSSVVYYIEVDRVEHL